MALTLQEIIDAPDEFILTKICEEASEVIKAVCKHQNFGPTPYAGGVQYDNVRDTNEEARQLNMLLSEYRKRWGNR